MKTLKFKVDDVLPALNKVATVVNPKNAIPVLGCILFETSEDGKELTLTSSDADLWLKVNVPIVTTDSAVKFCVDAKQIKQTLSSLTGREITIEVDEKSINGFYDNGQFTLPTQDAYSYPYSPVNANVKKHTNINSWKLLEAITMTNFAISDDELRPILQGIHFDFFNDRMVAAACDRVKIGRFVDDTTHNDGEVFGFTLPRKASHILQALITDDFDVEVEFDANNISFSDSSFNLTSRLIDGEYTNYESVIPHDNDKQAIVGKEEFLAAIKRVIPFGEAKTKMVVVKFEDNYIEIVGEDLAFNTFAKERVNCEYGYEPFKACFSGFDFINCVNNIEGDKFMISVKAPSMPAVITPYDNAKYISVLMPMIILGQKAPQQ